MVYAIDGRVVSLELKRDAHSASNSEIDGDATYSLVVSENAINRVPGLRAQTEPHVLALCLSDAIMLVDYVPLRVDGSAS